MIDLTPPRPAPVALVLRALKIGDLLVAVPALRALRRGLPEHRLVLAAPEWLLPLLPLVGGIDALLPTPDLEDRLPPPAGEADVAADLHGYGPESAGLVTEVGARITMAHRPWGRPAEHAPEWIPDLLERERWVRLTGAFGCPGDADDLLLARPASRSARPKATIVHVGAFYGSRFWPEERFAEVVRRLTTTGHDVVLTGTERERERVERVASAGGLAAEAVLAGRLGLAELAALVSEARLLVSADCGVAHLASAYRTPSAVIFGPAPPELWGPPTDGPHRALTHAELRRGEPFLAEPDPALEAVQVDEVLAAVDEVLAVPSSADRAAAVTPR